MGTGIPSLTQLCIPSEAVSRACNGYLDYIRSCAVGDSFRMNRHSETTPFALCFAIFGLRLLKMNEELARNADSFAEKLKKNLFAYRTERQAAADIATDKPFLQLLTFTLSCFSLLGCIQKYPLDEVIIPLLSRDVAKDLGRCRALEGVPQSGNMAMFMAIFLIYAKDHLAKNTQRQIDAWVELHLDSMNEHGFWGRNRKMTHLQFQNGYHQYEILNFLGVRNLKADKAASSVETLGDRDGHFAPYPGGGGCYDFDAVYILTYPGSAMTPRRLGLLHRTAQSILSEQNADGGFGESQKVRPRSPGNCIAAIRHSLTANGAVRRERIRQNLALIRPRHNRIRTHWSAYPRQWGESDLWASWFRMMTVARVECAFDPSAREHWSFIDFPGIGYFRPVGVTEGISEEEIR